MQYITWIRKLNSFYNFYPITYRVCLISTIYYWGNSLIACRIINLRYVWLIFNCRGWAYTIRCRYSFPFSAWKNYKLINLYFLYVSSIYLILSVLGLDHSNFGCYTAPLLFIKNYPSSTPNAANRSNVLSVWKTNRTLSASRLESYY